MSKKRCYIFFCVITFLMISSSAYHTSQITTTTDNSTLNNSLKTSGSSANYTNIIAFYNGSLDSIPEGWVLCNGSNGTPDLQERFIQSAISDYDLGERGGSETHKHNYYDLPNHTHYLEDPGHDHEVNDFDHVTLQSIDDFPIAPPAYVTTTFYYTAYAEVNITAKESGMYDCETWAAENLPPFYELAIIMKVSDTAEIAPGIIIMWNRSGSDIPEGWAFCNGSQGTPDLRDRFIRGVNSTTDPGTVGGNFTHNHTYIDYPKHSHFGNASHRHQYQLWWDTFSMLGIGSIPLPEAWGALTWRSTEDSYTGITIDSEGKPYATCCTDSKSNLPPYYKLGFIMKIDAPGEIPENGIVLTSDYTKGSSSKWLYCDGSKNTPDLRNRFVSCVDNSEKCGSFSGIESHNHSYSDLPTHTHDKIENPHRHEYWSYPGMFDSWGSGAGFSVPIYGTRAPRSNWMSNEQAGVSLSYAGVNNCSTLNTTILPPYEKLIYLMFTGTDTQDSILIGDDDDDDDDDDYDFIMVGMVLIMGVISLVSYGTVIFLIRHRLANKRNLQKNTRK